MFKSARFVKESFAIEKYVRHIKFDKLDVNRCMICTVLVVRCLERIVDHATYVGEAIYYVANGQKIILR